MSEQTEARVASWQEGPVTQTVDYMPAGGFRDFDPLMRREFDVRKVRFRFVSQAGTWRVSSVVTTGRTEGHVYGPGDELPPWLWALTPRAAGLLSQVVARPRVLDWAA